MKKIIIAGLGASGLEQLPLGIYRLLMGDHPVYLRTKEHPVVEELNAEGLRFQSFDSIYESFDDFHSVYEKIVELLLEYAEGQPIVYAVPGHPLVAERTVQLLLEKKDTELEVEIAGGQSFIDPLFQSVLMDPIEGFQLLDGTDFHHSQVQLKSHIIIGQVYDSMIASNVKLELMEVLPDTYEIYIITNAGGKSESIKKVPLYLLDHDWELNNLTSLYVPPVTDDRILYKNFQYLRDIIATLRGPNGCPWDKKQTHSSLKKYLLEEAYELLEAIDEQDEEHIIEELGDILLQVMLHAQIGEDDGYFSISDVIEAITDKMIRRHPHVFGSVQVENAEDVIVNWQKIKQEERSESSPQESVIEHVNKALPALMQAHDIQKAAAKVGFDWDEWKDCMEKVKEEIREVEKEITEGIEKSDLLMELGDLLFAVVNLARKLSIQPEEALIAANQKFIRRFQFIEKKVTESERTFSEFTLNELDRFWDEAKKQGL